RDAVRMSQLLAELLTLARADSGREEILRERVDLSELAVDVIQAMLPLAQARQVHLAAGPAEPRVVVGDATRLTQLLLNLVGNAISYTSAGGHVRVDVKQMDGWELLSVTDSGIGIAPEHLPHLFERFYRVDKARARSEGGTGLGLSIADWIVRAHGGHIEVTSSVGVGTTFTAWLPSLAPAHQAA
ncbi:MAG TPA: ATP-binding protein, partial [Chloroflexota bacterium]|nr:ATP-binding protein [Chloroflexota bacterium]